MDTSDDFWQIALQGGGKVPYERKDMDISSDESENDQAETSAVEYTLQFSGYPPLSLKLQAMPLNDGVWSPLGAQAWYGSALLTAYLLSTNYEKTSKLHEYLRLASDQSISALELGSGAVGLPSLALGWMLAHRPKSHPDIVDHVVLTDNDRHVLSQLELNIDSNIGNLQKHCQNVPSYNVEFLDWNDGYQPDDLPSGTCLESTSNLTATTGPRHACPQLVVGSELVYTTETATACVNVIRSILRQSRQILIVIIQIADRDGWNNVFLPSLRQDKLILVEDIPLVDPAIHEKASRLIRHGGSLDPCFDYALCCISSCTPACFEDSVACTTEQLEMMSV